MDAKAAGSSANSNRRGIRAAACAATAYAAAACVAIALLQLLPLRLAPLGFHRCRHPDNARRIEPAGCASAAQVGTAVVSRCAWQTPHSSHQQAGIQLQAGGVAYDPK